ncbi:hypothetical protein Dda_8991 [Drechslerella dactyloides]|uniref:Uncharacterized protein n=1 Tax=Drechslerella dactyloides TaxID=74499 RepID=A0AAD6ISI3_DREDA|nr:hypothetical protein Dda_8991 [Drechslerella dactyloides]
MQTTAALLSYSTPRGLDSNANGYKRETNLSSGAETVVGALMDRSLTKLGADYAESVDILRVTANWRNPMAGLVDPLRTARKSLKLFTPLGTGQYGGEKVHPSLESR